VSTRRPGARALGVYCDYRYSQVDGSVFAELPFSAFVEGLAPHFDRLVVFGRLDPDAARFPYRVTAAQLVPLPYYSSGANLADVIRAAPAAIAAFWRELDELDVVWILGPNPIQAPLFALLGLLRRRRVVLGVRQNLPELIRHRWPGRRHVQAAAHALEQVFRTLASAVPVIVVGPDLAYRYRRSRSLLNIFVSLLRDADLQAGSESERNYDGDQLVILSVGRIDPEKNPLLMADILKEISERDDRWRLEVCGDGPLKDALAQRAAQLGVAERIVLHGHVPVDDGLRRHYRDAHALLPVSMTEGVPQVILEAFAARLPVVATDVGGVGALVRGRGLLCKPRDARAAAAALEQIATDPALRTRCVAAARAVAEEHTLESECARVAAFLSGGD
jgi:glycosyltransferase involved in cell wall biosynthesis